VRGEGASPQSGKGEGLVDTVGNMLEVHGGLDVDMGFAAEVLFWGCFGCLGWLFSFDCEEHFLLLEQEDGIPSLRVRCYVDSILVAVIEWNEDWRSV